MRRAVQETRYRAHGHAPESAAHHRAEDQSIADISGHKSGYNIRHVHANDFDIQPFIFEKTFLQSYARRKKGHIGVRHRDTHLVGSVETLVRYPENQQSN